MAIINGNVRRAKQVNDSLDIVANIQTLLRRQISGKLGL